MSQTERRFGFGRNWQNFARKLTETQVEAATRSLQLMLGVEDLKGMTLLDAGCGSGLFSLAACRLGAQRVVSFDYDMQSIACARSLQKRFGPFDNWSIIPGDALDPEFLSGLGQFDIVYSWGVLHHTGDMWRALDCIVTTVRPGGRLFISLYNDQGAISRGWGAVKHFYVESPAIVQKVMAASWYAVTVLYRIYTGIRHGKSPSLWLQGSERGMSLWYDVVDWIGGYPFETATPEAVIEHYENRGFTTEKVNRKHGSGCNEFVFRNRTEQSGTP